MLAREGHQVATATNGLAGLQLAQQEVPDLIVLDVMLPGLDGFEVCHRLRGTPSTSRVPVLMVSAKGQAADRDAALRVGANEYLVKPLDRAQFLQSVEGLLRREQTAPRREVATVAAFIGARGGVGTSTTAASVAVGLAQAGHAIILVDLSPSLGMLPSLLGLRPGQGIGNLLQARAGSPSREDIEAALAHHSSGVRLLVTAESSEGGGAEISPASLRRLLQELIVSARYVLLDAPASPSESAAAALARCDVVLMVAGPGPDSGDRINSVAAVLSRMGVAREKLGAVLIDRSGIGDSNETVIAGIPVLGMIPFGARECAEAEARKTPVILSAPDSALAAALRTLTVRLIALAERVAAGR